VPAELSDETSKDGATKFEDIEGGGIGEGEGVKDVSEQIESEEQVLADVSYVLYSAVQHPAKLNLQLFRLTTLSFNT